MPDGHGRPNRCPLRAEKRYRHLLQRVRQLLALFHSKRRWTMCPDRPGSCETCREIRETVCVARLVRRTPGSRLRTALASAGLHPAGRPALSNPHARDPCERTQTGGRRARPRPARPSGRVFVLAPPNCSLGGASSSMESSMVIVCVRLRPFSLRSSAPSPFDASVSSVSSSSGSSASLPARRPAGEDRHRSRPRVPTSPQMPRH